MASAIREVGSGRGEAQAMNQNKLCGQRRRDARAADQPQLRVMIGTPIHFPTHSALREGGEIPVMFDARGRHFFAFFAFSAVNPPPPRAVVSVASTSAPPAQSGASSAPAASQRSAYT